MKKILTASLVAIMAVTAARAEIASTEYVTTRTGDVLNSTYVKGLEAGKQNLVGAVEKLAAEIGTGGSVSGQIDDKIEDVLGDGFPANKTVAQAISDAQTAAVTTAGSNADAKITTAKQAMKLDKVGGLNMYIKSVTQTDGTVTAEVGNVDTEVTSNSTNLITSGAVSTAIAAANTEVTNLKKTVAANTAGIDGLVQNSATKEELTTAQNDLTSAIATAKQEAIAAVNNANTTGSAANLAKTAQNEVDALEQVVAADKQAQAGVDSNQNTNITNNANAISAMDAAYKKADADAKTAADNTYLSMAKIGADGSFVIPENCKGQNVTCSLVINNGVAGWEVVAK